MIGHCCNQIITGITTELAAPLLRHLKTQRHHWVLPLSGISQIGIVSFRLGAAFRVCTAGIPCKVPYYPRTLCSRQWLAHYRMPRLNSLRNTSLPTAVLPHLLIVHKPSCSPGVRSSPLVRRLPHCSWRYLAPLVDYSVTWLAGWDLSL